MLKQLLTHQKRSLKANIALMHYNLLSHIQHKVRMHKAGQQPVEEEQQQLLYKKILEVSKYITNVESNLQIKSLPKKNPLLVWDQFSK